MLTHIIMIYDALHVIVWLEMFVQATATDIKEKLEQFIDTSE